MPRAFTPNKIRKLVFRDFKRLIDSSEHQDFKIKYQYNLGNKPIDPVYGHPEQSDAEEIEYIEIEFKGFIVSLKASDTEFNKFEFLESGDTFIYVYGQLNLSEPVEGKRPIESTLLIVDPSGNRWTPDIRKSEDLQRNFEVLLGNDVLSTVIKVEKIEGMDVN